MINDDLDDKKNMLQVSLVFAVQLQYGLWV